MGEWIPVDEYLRRAEPGPYDVLPWDRREVAEVQGTARACEERHVAELTAEQRRQAILVRVAAGERLADIAGDLGISASAVSQTGIRNGLRRRAPRLTPEGRARIIEAQRRRWERASA